MALSTDPQHKLLDIRVAVWELVVTLVCLHGQLQIACLTGETCLVPNLYDRQSNTRNILVCR